MAKLAAENSHESIQNKLKYTAELEMAEMDFALSAIEARAGAFEAAMESMGETVSALSEQVTGMISAFISPDISLLDKWAIEDWIDDSLRMQKDLVDSTVKLNDEYIKTERARQEALKKDIKVEIQSNGQDWLDGLIKDLIEEIVLKAKQEGFQAFGYDG